MDIEFAFLALSAEVNPDATTNAAGIGMRHGHAPVAPANLPPLAVVTHIRSAPNEITREVGVTVRFVTPDAQQLAESQSVLPPATEDIYEGEPRLSACICFFPQLRVPSFGRYEYRIFLDGQRKGTVYFSLHRQPSAT